jgi:hypothetical protein
MLMDCGLECSLVCKYLQVLSVGIMVVNRVRESGLLELMIA